MSLSKRVALALTFVVSLAACGGPPGFEIEVAFPTDLGIDQLVFQLSAEGAATVAPVSAPKAPVELTSGTESAVFLLPEDMLDKEVSIVVEALAAGRGVASGSATAQSKSGTIVGVSIVLDPSPLGCGNSIKEVDDEGEECDDGNTEDGDGCSAQCTFEAGWTCNGTAEGDLSTCDPICGDGIVRGDEECDDSSTANGDGCDAGCFTEVGWQCVSRGEDQPSECNPLCGDGVRAGAEPCDDGALEDGDGCSSACEIEVGWACDEGVPTLCEPICGDGIVVGGEACDDGGLVAGDGCASSCLVEDGFTCDDTAEPSSCKPTCGDGLLLGGEPCDDANTVDDDGCSSSCAREAGWLCDGASPTVCTSICGDGLLRGTEICDDDDLDNGDGCDSICTPEMGFACGTSEPSLCTPICGDALLLGGEPCDDGATVNGDGCSAICDVELGFTCSGAPSTCAAVCGDGLRRVAEACDDDNTTAGDGCAANCTVEPGFQCDLGEPSICDEICGDGLQLGDEECDDGGDAVTGNSDTRGDACRLDCTLPRCGDTTTDPGLGETCDDGDTDNDDGCLTACIAAGCGDGFRDAPEACDDGNGNNGDGCSTTCTIEAGFLCGGEPSFCALDAVAHTVGGFGSNFNNITAAVNNGAVNDGHTLFLRAFTFNERVTLDKDLTVVAEPGTVLTDSSSGSGQTLTIDNGSVVVIRNLQIQNTSSNRGNIVVEDNGTSATFIGCRLGPSPSFGLDQRNGTTVAIQRTRVTGNALGGLLLAGSFTVESSVITQNGGSAGASTGGARLQATGTFQFNTVTGNLSATGGGVLCQVPNAVTSSIVFGNAGAQVNASCNASTSILTDPDFAADGFHLDVGSPARDLRAACPIIDFDGDERPINEACDVGADERP